MSLGARTLPLGSLRLREDAVSPSFPLSVGEARGGVRTSPRSCETLKRLLRFRSLIMRRRRRLLFVLELTFCINSTRA